MLHKGCAINVLNFLGIARFADTEIATAHAMCLTREGTSIYTIKDYLQEHFGDIINRCIPTLVNPRKFIEYISRDWGTNQYSIIKCYFDENGVNNDTGHAMIVYMSGTHHTFYDPQRGVSFERGDYNYDMEIERWYKVGIFGLTSSDGYDFGEDIIMKRVRPSNIKHGGARDANIKKFILTCHSMYKSMIIYQDLVMSGMVQERSKDQSLEDQSHKKQSNISPTSVADF
jgi:hypothetical protein